MDIGSLLLILALLILVGLFVSRPLFDQKEYAPGRAMADSSDPADHERSSLLAERDRLLNALQELDFDHALGKIPEEDYPAQRARLVQQGAAVLRRLDEIQVGSSQDDTEARLEAAIAARRADAGRQAGEQAEAVTVGQNTSTPNGHKPAPASPDVAAANKPATASRGVVTVSSPDDSLEALLADRRRTRQEKSGGFCPQCGRSVQKSDRFCPKCGAKLA
jgi:hypothetical protein